MAEKSVALRNLQAAQLEAALGASPRLQFHSGLRPTNAAAARSGTLLADMTLPADPLSAASSGAVSLLGTWSDTSANNAGLAGYFSLLDNAAATCHLQGLVSEPWTASKAYVVGRQVHNGGNVYRCTTAGTSASSGGPTGTGTGINDGTAVWSYLGPVEMTLDNVDIAVGQAVTVTGFTYTIGGAGS